MIPSFKIEFIDSCILCNSSVVASDNRFSFLLGLKQPFAVSKCQRCDLRWLNPRPTQEAYTKLYTNGDYFCSENTPDDYRKLASMRIPYFCHRLLQIERHFPHARKLTILDIGAATGEFLGVAVTRGHDVVGVEFSDDARRSAYERHGIQLHGPDSLPTVDNGYDVIHMNHVLEHLPNPLTTLNQCHQVLKPGGLIVIEVPRQFDNDLDRLKRFLSTNNSPAFNAYSLHHTFFFTPKVLFAFLVMTGFHVLQLHTANPHRTPLWPPSFKNSALRILLYLSDKLHQAGNIIETYALKPTE